MTLFLLGRPVGSGKTALTLALCQRLRKEYNIGTHLLICAILIIYNPWHRSYCYQRHIHPRRPRVPHQEQGTSCIPDSCNRNRRLSSCCHPRRYQCEHGRARNAASKIWVSDLVRRKRWRQPSCELLARAGGLHNLRHRRLGTRACCSSPCCIDLTRSFYAGW